MWGMDSISQTHIPELWDRRLRGDGVKIGVIGTGIDLLHPDFEGRPINAASLVPGDVQDYVPHETGIVWVLTRIAPNAEIFLVKDRIGEIGSLSTLITACQQLLAMNVDIVNLSMAGDVSYGIDPLSREVNYLTAHNVVVVCAAGNFGPRPRTIGTPGIAETAITVGKVDEHDRVARNSSRGPTRDGRMKPDCVAPGHSIIAAVPRSYGSRYGVYSCTSFATPHVTGALALLKQAYPPASTEELKRAILESCDPASVPFDVHKHEYSTGAGRLNASRAYEVLMKNV
jgi:subtilisin family serine protease